MRSNRPYVQLDPAVIEQARQMDLLSYLQRYEPNNLKRVAGNVYCTNEDFQRQMVLVVERFRRRFCP